MGRACAPPEGYGEVSRFAHPRSIDRAMVFSAGSPPRPPVTSQLPGRHASVTCRSSCVARDHASTPGPLDLAAASATIPAGVRVASPRSRARLRVRRRFLARARSTHGLTMASRLSGIAAAHRAASRAPRLGCVSIQPLADSARGPPIAPGSAHCSGVRPTAPGSAPLPGARSTYILATHPRQARVIPGQRTAHRMPRSGCVSIMHALHHHLCRSSVHRLPVGSPGPAGPHGRSRHEPRTHRRSR